MTKLIDEFLKQHGSNRYQVAKISGIGETTLAGANNSPLNNITVKTLQALGMATGMDAGDVLNELISLESDPVISFIQVHPYMDKDLVKAVQDIMMRLREQQHGDFKNITFNRYYEEGKDTNANAEKALQNLLDSIDNIQDVISKIKDNSLDK